MNFRRKIVYLLATVALVCGMAVTNTGQASAAPGCTPKNPAKYVELPFYPYGRKVPVANCNAYRAGTVWHYRNNPSGELFAGVSWFVCQKQYTGWQNPPIGVWRNDWWLWTLADRPYPGQSGWGWFPATHISGGGNYQPVPGLRPCD